MAILNTRELKERGAAAAREHRGGTVRLVLLYCGVIAAISLGSNGLNLYLDAQIGTTGGLDGLGLRTILQTVQEALSYINMLFGPFWAAGFLYSMIGMVRGQEPACRDLTEGFRRFGRVLFATIYELMLAVSLAMAAMMVAFGIFLFSPWGTAVSAILEPVLPSLILADGTVDMTQFPQAAMTYGVIPLVVLWVVLFFASYIFLRCCFRMGTYLMMERKIGGVAALFESRRLMRGHKWQMLKLDLRFWWYYALNGVISAVGYLDVILALFGVELPVSSTVMFFLTLVAYCVLQTALSLWKKCEVDAAYVLAFEAIAHPEPETAVAEMG